MVGCTKLDVDEPWGQAEVRHLYRVPAAIPVPQRTDGDYSIIVPLGVQRRQFVLAARDALQMGKNVRLFEADSPRHAATMVSSMGELHIGAGSQVGAVYGFGDQMVLEDGINLEGYGKSAGPYFGPYRSPAIIDRVTEYAEEFRWTVRPQIIPAKAPDITSQSDNLPLDAAPGVYGILSVESGSTIRLRGGSYFLDALLLRPRGILQIDNTSEPVYIWVKNSLAIDGAMLEYVDRPSILLGYLGTETPRISMPLHATLVAPNASITLPATHGPHRGAVFARSISVDDDAEIESRSFVGWASTAEPPYLVCSRCAIVATSVMGSCCDDFELMLANVRLNHEVCEAQEGPQREASANNGIEARLKFRECIMSAAPRFVECEMNSRYREDTCENLGYGFHFMPECTQ